MTTLLPPSVQAALGGAESEAEALLLNRLKWLGVPPFQTQVLLIPGRKFRFDVVFPDFKVAVELQGGQHVRGRHLRAAGYEQDCVKSALAQIAGYLVIACTPAQVQSGVAGHLILAALRARGGGVGAP